MFKTILVPTDGSPLAEKAFDAAVEAAKASNGKLIGISVARPYTHPRPTEGSPIPDYSKDYEQKTLRLAREHVQKLADAAAKIGVPCETHTPCSLDAIGEILAAARQFHCDVIFIASHGRSGISKLLLGSVAHGVLAGSPVPVLIFR